MTLCYQNATTVEEYINDMLGCRRLRTQTPTPIWQWTSRTLRRAYPALGSKDKKHYTTRVESRNWPVRLPSPEGTASFYRHDKLLVLTDTFKNWQAYEAKKIAIGQKLLRPRDV